jgi:hypothetical protein
MIFLFKLHPSSGIMISYSLFLFCYEIISRKLDAIFGQTLDELVDDPHQTIPQLFLLCNLPFHVEVFVSKAPYLLSGVS